MIISHHDPEKPKLIDAQKARMDVCWLKGQIGDNTYLRSLFFYGYLPKDANTELNLLKMEKEETQRVRLARFSSAK